MSDWIRAYEGKVKFFIMQQGRRIICLSIKVSGKKYLMGCPRTDWDWIIYPQGLYDQSCVLKILIQIIKIYITENGLGYKDNLRTVK